MKLLGFLVALQALFLLPYMDNPGVKLGVSMVALQFALIWLYIKHPAAGDAVGRLVAIGVALFLGYGFLLALRHGYIDITDLFLIARSWP